LSGVARRVVVPAVFGVLQSHAGLTADHLRD
jgi:hypothetical protein